jgi:hypothetical protein
MPYPPPLFAPPPVEVADPIEDDATSDQGFGPVYTGSEHFRSRLVYTPPSFQPAPRPMSPSHVLLLQPRSGYRHPILRARHLLDFDFWSNMGRQRAEDAGGTDALHRPGPSG